MEGGQAEAIRRLMTKCGGSATDVWAVGPRGEGFARFDGTVVHVHHAGFLGRLDDGRHIPVETIIEVRFQAAGPRVAGFIQFATPDAPAPRTRFGLPVYDPAVAEGSLLFGAAEQPYFAILRDAVERAVATARRDGREGVRTAHADAVLDQLERLGDLRERGLLTEEEFAAKKAELLKRL